MRLVRVGVCYLIFILKRKQIPSELCIVNRKCQQLKVGSCLGKKVGEARRYIVKKEGNAM